MEDTKPNIWSDIIKHFGDTLTSTADALDCSIQTIANYRDGRPTPPELCIEIEKKSKRKFCCEQIRPDVDWAYLRSSRKKAA